MGALSLRSITPTDETDQAALGKIAKGELGAMDELYDRYSTMAYSIAVRITHDAALAEDVVHDAFLGAWRNATSYSEGRGSVKTWLLAIVHHRAIDAIRRHRQTSQFLEQEVVLPAAWILPDVWAEVSASLDAEAVRIALAGLLAVQREAIELAYFAGLTQEEIATRTGAPLGTIKSRVRMGLLAMRHDLERTETASDIDDVRFGRRRRPAVAQRTEHKKRARNALAG